MCVDEKEKSMTTRKTRPDTRLPQSRAGGQELHHLGRSGEAIDRKKSEKSKV